MDSNVAARLAFGYYLRTGRRSVAIFAGDHRRLETKFNPYHDPTNGRFTFAPGGPRSLYRDTERSSSRPVSRVPAAGAAAAISAHFKTR
jgi:hypothetical protein